MEAVLKGLGHILLYHLGDVVQGIGILAGVVAGMGWVKNDQYRKTLEDAVMFVEQWKKVQAENGNPVYAPAVLRLMAIEFVKRKYPKANVALLVDQIEALVHALTDHTKVAKPERAAETQETTFTEGMVVRAIDAALNSGKPLSKMQFPKDFINLSGR